MFPALRGTDDLEFLSFHVSDHLLLSRRRNRAYAVYARAVMRACQHASTRLRLRCCHGSWHRPARMPHHLRRSLSRSTTCSRRHPAVLTPHATRQTARHIPHTPTYRTRTGTDTHRQTSIRCVDMLRKNAKVLGVVLVLALVLVLVLV